MFGGGAAPDPSRGAPGMQAYTVPSVDDYLDLEDFVDNYLVNLQADHTNQMNPALRAQFSNQQQARMPSLPNSAAPAGGYPGLPQQQQLQQLNMPANLLAAGGASIDGLQQLGLFQSAGGSVGNNPLLNMTSLGNLNSLGSLGGIMGPQLRSPAIGQPQMLPTGVGLGTSILPTAPGTAGPASAAAAKSNKTTRRGRGSGGTAGKNSKKSEPEPSSSEDDSLGSASSDGDNKSRKKQMTADEAERRHQALQEKNRRAQRRFRERQKNKLSDLHKQIEDLTTKVSSLQSENAALHSRTSILEKVLDMRNEQIQVMQETKETTGYPGGEDDLASLQGPLGGHLVQLSPEMIKELGSDQIYKIYQMYVKELSLRLVEVNRTPAAEAQHMQDLESLVKDLSMMIMRLGVIKPLETRKFIVVSRQYLGNTEAEVIDLWKNVMKSIDLTDQQKREVVELKRMFLQKIEPIMEERKHLNVQIQSNLPHDTFHTKNALTYIKAHEAVIKLRDNLRAEQHVVLEFAIAVFRGVFRPKQMAGLLVKCYPAVPDALGIASALAAELGEPDSPHARSLAMQLGGYLDSGGRTLGTNYLTIHPSLMQSGAGAGPSTGALPGLLTAAVPAASAPASGTGVGAGSLGMAGPENEQFSHWMQRPGVAEAGEQLLGMPAGQAAGPLGPGGLGSGASFMGLASQLAMASSSAGPMGLPDSMAQRISESASGQGGSTSST